VGDSVVKWNFCEEYIRTVEAGCPPDSYAYITSLSEPKCYGLKEGEDDSPDTFAVETRDDNGNINGLSLQYHGGSNMCFTDPS
jgi:hypothetical protein